MDGQGGAGCKSAAEIDARVSSGKAGQVSELRFLDSERLEGVNSMRDERGCCDD